MIRYIKGTLHLTKSTDSIIIDTPAGIGFRVFVPIGSIYRKMLEGSEVSAFTATIVKEDAISLYGFETEDDLELFEMLISVSGIGARGAMSIMGTLSPLDLKRAIANGDAKAISAANGIGKKTAERVIIDLRDKITGEFSAPEGPAGPENAETKSEKEEAVAALMSLGYTRNEVSRLVENIQGDNLKAEDYIRAVLREL
ncbi:MAG: Holliday junction branch migration protein RuvA [Eubacterium sp.]|jgi:Holliday junction DNA helicase RuvA